MQILVPEAPKEHLPYDPTKEPHEPVGPPTSPAQDPVSPAYVPPSEVPVEYVISRWQKCTYSFARHFD